MSQQHFEAAGNLDATIGTKREGFWDAVLSGKLAQWIMTIEEEDLDGDYVPEESRQNERSGTAYA
jgi:hypothetical protein